jgi:hypothetical protein
MLMTGTVLGDPLLVASSAQHAEDDITRENGWQICNASRS